MNFIVPMARPNSSLFSTEQVSCYHPDKYADQISDAILTSYLSQDIDSHCGIETMVKDNTIVLGGEITSKGVVNHEETARRVADKLGYKVDKVIDLIGLQSTEIGNAVDADKDIGAGDQGIMFGFATRETESRLPFGFDLANKIIAEIEGSVNDHSVLQGDAKTQVTVDLGKTGMDSVQAVLVSACHSPYVSPDILKNYIKDLLAPLELPKSTELIVNPAGSWTIGGPTADCGLTGRKIVCDQYGGYIPVGGGAFSGKDPSKVDRSASYMARKIACDVLEQFETIQWAQVQLAYAIGMSKPMSIYITTNDPEIDRVVARWVTANYDLTPRAIINSLKLYKKDYEQIAAGCHYRTDSGLFQ